MPEAVRRDNDPDLLSGTFGSEVLSAYQCADHEQVRVIAWMWTIDGGTYAPMNHRIRLSATRVIP